MAKKTKIDLKIAKDPVAAKEYNDLVDLTYDHPDRYVIKPDGEVVDLFDMKFRVVKKLEGLDPEVVKKSMETHAFLHDKFRRMGLLKRKAFDIKGGVATARSETGLLEPLKANIMEWFGRLYSDQEIQKKMADSGLPVSLTLIQKFRQKHKKEIDALQAEYEKDWKSVPISRKRSRLDQLAHIYMKHKEEFDNAQGTNSLPYSREMRAILDQVRKEVEGDAIKLTVDGKIDINATVAVNKTVEELYSSINFMSLLIGRVAARFKINPAVLHYQLMNSWYNKFTGVRQSDNLKELTPNYPSSIVYNWDEIRKRNEAKNEIYDKIAKTIEVEDVNTVEELKGRKQKMKELMLEKMKMLDTSKERL